jgi:hypothetical protein
MCHGLTHPRQVDLLLSLFLAQGLPHQARGIFRLGHAHQDHDRTSLDVPRTVSTAAARLMHALFLRGNGVPIMCHGLTHPSQVGLELFLFLAQGLPHQARGTFRLGHVHPDLARTSSSVPRQVSMAAVPSTRVRLQVHGVPTTSPGPTPQRSRLHPRQWVVPQSLLLHAPRDPTQPVARLYCLLERVRQALDRISIVAKLIVLLDVVLETRAVRQQVHVSRFPDSVLAAANISTGCPDYKPWTYEPSGTFKCPDGSYPSCSPGGSVSTQPTNNPPTYPNTPGTPSPPGTPPPYMQPPPPATGTCPKACLIHFNSCDKTTAPTCIFPDPYVAAPRGACACRPGYKASYVADGDTTKQWRLPVVGQEHRVWVAEGVVCGTLCTNPYGVGSCREVKELGKECIG